MIRTLSLVAILVLTFGSRMMAVPPAELLGYYLYFEEGPDDYLIFLDGTDGEERDLAGDVDPFSYTYTVNGASTAQIVVTFDSVDGDYDEWDLTYSADGKGTFVRRKYKDNLLEDTDTGQFIENSGATFPPADLIGVRLEEAVELEDERFEFLTGTDGREFEPGDVDPFTYVYNITGADTATLVATRKPGDRWDELDLVFDSETTGAYTLSRYDDGILKDEKRGNFRLDENTNTIDGKVGDSLKRLFGDDFFNGTGKHQTEKVILKRKGSARVFVEVENDGNDDSVSVRSRRGTKKFRIAFTQLRPRRNVTAQITRGSGIERELEHAERERIEIKVTPKAARGKLNLPVRSSSRSIAGANDLVKIQVQKK